jgi:hypothetical protein
MTMHMVWMTAQEAAGGRGPALSALNGLGGESCGEPSPPPPGKIALADRVAADFPIEIADEADLQLFAQELRRAPVKVKIGAVPILRGRIHEIVGDAKHRGKFVAGFRVEIGIAYAGIDRPVSDPKFAKFFEL